ncbi:MAG: YbhB/YbcL family Raf kinase inhibitor-like protein [Propionibacteriaceae bacterium]|jgi:Raf kinase inhibitor-like YbhB/YbcL family protein|nr:YbhB/YbcL family Raf kinase inhibitor-like protein [Propionibacteriaceae bacterium]
MELISKAIPDGSTIDKRYIETGAGGENVSPDLTWSGAPEGTQSFALTCYDPDAPHEGGFWHWIVTDIAPTVTHLDENEVPPSPARQWESDYGKAPYGGPWPPKGWPHRYVFTVYALNEPSVIVEGAPRDFAAALDTNVHVLDSASFTGIYETK